MGPGRVSGVKRWKIYIVGGREMRRGGEGGFARERWMWGGMHLTS